VDILVIDALGQPSYRLLSPHAVEATEGGGTDLEQPVLTVYEQDRVPADSRADHGWLSSDLSLLRLEGNVNLVRAPATDGPTTTLDTPWLLVYPQLNRAETEAAVVITAPGQRLEGVGMRADLQREHYQLLSQVRGQHEVTTR
jgi:lipopolysaccharide export system protein LptC